MIDGFVAGSLVFNDALTCPLANVWLLGSLFAWVVSRVTHHAVETL
jgi:hypothetical protein